MSLTIITDIRARQILDSRGNPTVEVDVELAGGAVGRAAVPSGASTGEHEAWELRDGVKDRYLGKGVTKAVGSIEKTIAPELEGFDALEQVTIDKMMIELDGTPNKASLGANALLAVSLATAHAAANQLGLPLFKYLGGPNAKVLPVPMMNILNGGAHSDAPIDFQEFMVMPKKFDTFSEALRAGTEIFHALKGVLKGRGLSTAIGDEGGFAPKLDDAFDALETIAAAVKKAGYKLGEDVFIALDVAASEFFDKGKGKYVFKKSDGSERSAEELVAYYGELKAKYPIISIEDGCAENDWDGWKMLTDKLGGSTQLVGDDLFVTNVEFLRKGIETRHRQLDPREGEPDRHAHRDPRRHRAREGKPLHGGDFAPLRRDRGHHHRRHRGGHECGPDQDGLALPNGPRGEVQSAVANRRRTW